MNPTDKEVYLLIPILLIFSLLLFFYPLAAGHKEPAVGESVHQNMKFLDEMVAKYIQHNRKPPETLAALLQDAKKRTYNKTFFNPLNKVTGDLDNQQLVVQYHPQDIEKMVTPNLAPVFYEGKIGYFTKGTRYFIYGHIRQGQLLTQDGRVLVLKNG